MRRIFGALICALCLCTPAAAGPLDTFQTYVNQNIVSNGQGKIQGNTLNTALANLVPVFASMGSWTPQGKFVLNASALPPPTATSLGGVKAASAGPHQFVCGLNIAGSLTFCQPSISDISGFGTAAQKNVSGASVVDPGTGNLETVLPIQTVTGAVKSFGQSDLNIETRRANSGSSMNDAFPAASTTGLVNGTRIVVKNADAISSDTITAGAGTTFNGSVSTDVVGPGRTIVYGWDSASLTWRHELNTDTALLSTNNLSDVSSQASARGNLGLGTLATQNSSSVLLGGVLSSPITGPSNGTQSPLAYTDLQIGPNSTNTQYGGNMALLQFSTDASSAFIAFAKSRGTSTSKLPVVSGDNFAEINGNAWDGSGWVDSAYFDFDVDGPVTTGSVPTRFAWGAINTSGAYNEHMRLSANAVLTVGDLINNTYNQLNINPNSGTTSPSISVSGSSTNLGLTLSAKGTGAVNVATQNFSVGDNSTYNQIVLNAEPNGTAALIRVLSPTANEGFTFETQGLGNFSFASGGFAPAFAILAIASSVNYVAVTPAVSGSPAIIGSVGSDSNIGLNLVAQGTGTVSVTGSGGFNVVGTYFANGTGGVTCSGTPTSSFASKNGIITHC